MAVRRSPGAVAATLLAIAMIAAVVSGGSIVASVPALARPAAEGAGEDAATIRDRIDALRGELAAARLERLRFEGENEALVWESEEADQAVAAKHALVRGHEGRVAALSRELKRLVARRADLKARLDARIARSGAMLMALDRLARLPPLALLLRRDAPGGIARSAAALRAVVADLEQRIETLRRDLIAVDEALEEIRQHRRALDEAIAGLDTERDRLDRLRADQAATQEELSRHRQEAVGREQRLAARIDRLSAEADRLEAVERARRARDERIRRTLATATLSTKPPAPSPMQGLAGPTVAQALAGSAIAGNGEKPSIARNGEKPPPRTAAEVTGPVFPASGRVVAGFGAPAADPVTGPITSPATSPVTSKGVTFATAPGAGVVAPAPGLVAFAGPFRGYGLLLIVEHPDGYHTLLAGMERIDAVLGERVGAGEPIGVMGRPRAGDPYLYLELRKDGRPVNPLPWLTAGKRKVSG